MKTKDITINGIGIALFVALSMCLRVPVFQNYYLCLGYIVMAMYCYSVGVISGTIVGVMGTVLYCVLINGLRGMPGWALGNIAIGFMMGFAFKIAKKIRNKILGILISVMGIVLGTTVGILLIKSGAECILYDQPMLVRITTNMYAYVADVVILVISLPICKLVDFCKMKNSSLN